MAEHKKRQSYLHQFFMSLLIHSASNSFTPHNGISPHYWAKLLPLDKREQDALGCTNCGCESVLALAKEFTILYIKHESCMVCYL